MRRLKALALSLESSCDDSCFSFYTPRLLGLRARIYRLKHKLPLFIYGGVVPKQSSLLHSQTFSKIRHLPQFLAYTHGPGIFECLNAAKTVANKLPISTLPINHLHAHIVMSLPHSLEKYPFLALVISGGHTLIALCTAPNRYIIMGQTYDDSFGECYDKVLRGVFPNQHANFHQLIENMYHTSSYHSNKAFVSPLEKEHPQSLNFSFCGIKTHYKTLLHADKIIARDFVKLFIDNMFDCVFRKLARSIQILNASALTPKFIVISGGCSANFSLRNKVINFCDKVDVYLCNPNFSGDNAHMILKAAIYNLKNRCISLTSKKPATTWTLNELKADE